MRDYILKRVLVTIPALVIVSMMIFSLVRLFPGDTIVAMASESGSFGFTKDAENQIRAILGIDKPFLTQYFNWIGGLLTGDAGISLWTRQPVTHEIARTFPISLELAVFSSVVGIAVALPAGIIAALKRNTFPDLIARFVSLVGLSVPSFWIATMLLVFFSVQFRWIPPVIYQSFADSPGGNLLQFLFPSLLLGFGLSATTMRMTRSAMLEVLREDYVRTARAKGLTERVVIFRHALRNAFIPVVTIIGTQLAYLLGGTIIIEVIFGLPGLGRLTLEAVTHRDYTQIQANVMLIASITMFVNLVVDLSYGWLDPRIRYS